MFDRKSDLVRFLALVDCRNVVIAARELGLTHQAMSYTLDVLTRRAGGPLFERRPEGLRPTPLGVAAEALARRLLRAHEDGEERLGSLREGRSGRLHATAAAGFLQTVLPAAVAAFHDDHPGVEVALQPAGDDVLDLLAGSECDLYCGPAPARGVPPELRRTRLPALAVGLVAARGHPLEGREPGWQDLADYPWIDYGTEPLGFAEGRTSLAALHAAIRRRTGRPIRRVMRAVGSSLELMQTRDYLSQLPLDFLDRPPGRFLVPLPGRRGPRHHPRDHPHAALGRCPSGHTPPARGRGRCGRGGGLMGRFGEDLIGSLGESGESSGPAMCKHYPAVVHGGNSEPWGLPFVELPVNAAGGDH